MVPPIRAKRLLDPFEARKERHFPHLRSTPTTLKAPQMRSLIEPQVHRSVGSQETTPSLGYCMVDLFVISARPR